MKAIDAPTVTVIMPVYNSAAYLKEAVDSILNQRFTDFELLAIDDGSSDGSLEILNQIDDPRLKVLSDGQNLQQPKRYNQGIELARGKYIAIMHADDIALPHRLEKQVRFLEEHAEYDLVGSRVYFFNEQGLYQRPSSNKKRGIYLQIYTLFNCPFFHPSILIRKHILANHLYKEDFTTAEDYELWSRILRNSKGANLSEILLHYRIHSSNNSRRKNQQQLLNIQKIWQQQFDWLGISVEQTDLNTQLFCSHSYHQALKLDELVAAGNWLLQLKQKLQKNPDWEESLIRQVIYQTWLTTCKKASGNGWKAVQVFWQNPISKMGFDVVELFVFLVKCFLKYRSQ